MKTYLAAILVLGLVGSSLSATSCVGRCGENDYTTGCQCNVLCSDYGDCCSDFDAVCLTCADRCGDAYVQTAPCHCNSECSSHSNCCSDYDDLCDGGGVTPGEVTDQDVLDVSSELFNLDENNMGASVTLDMQGSTSSGGSSDEAPGPLITSSPDLSADTYVAFEALRDNYNREQSTPDDITAAEDTEIEAFLDAVMNTTVMMRLDEFFTAKGVLTGTLRDNLKEIWFTLYVRSGSSQENSSGFEHVFIGEIDPSNEVNGFHNWVSYLREEQQGNINYQGYIEYLDFGAGTYVYTDRYTWYGSDKPIGGYYVGTSVEYDMAVFTLCFFTRPNSKCSVMANGLEHKIQTYEQNYSGKVLVGTSYPAVN